MSNPLASFRALDWAQVDVFAEAALEGNMLAVFADGRSLTDAEMQAIARETNLSETTFILPRNRETERRDGVRVRIFTTQEELPFAGHPTLGTASWLWLHHADWRGQQAIPLHLNVGPVVVRFAAEQDGPGVLAEMTQRDPTFGDTLPAAAVARAMGLPLEALHPALPPQVVSTGLPQLIVPVRSVAAMAGLRVDAVLLDALLGQAGARFAYAMSPVGALEQGSRPADWHARMQFYSGEDPATGSAAGCAVSYLVRHGAVASGQQIVIRQGLEIHRPSRILATASLVEGRVQDVRIGGRTIPVAAGRFLLSEHSRSPQGMQKPTD